MIARSDFTTTGTLGAERLVAVCTQLIIISWWLTALVGVFDPTLSCYGLGFHPCAQAPLEWRLFAYLLLHRFSVHFILQVAAFAIIVLIASSYLSPVTFLRVFWLGGLASGALFLWATKQSSVPTLLLGADGAVMALVGEVYARVVPSVDPSERRIIAGLMVWAVILTVIGTLFGEGVRGPAYDSTVAGYLPGLLVLAGGLVAGVADGLLGWLRR